MSTYYATLNGIQVTHIDIAIPYYGIWEGDVQLSTPQVITGPVTLIIGDLTLIGSVYRYSSFAGLTSLRLVGGAGGWRKAVTAQAYANPAGVRLSTVMFDVASAVGETVVVGTDAIIGQFYTREANIAQRVLRMLAGAEWYIDVNGVTQVRPRVGVAIGTPLTVIDWDPATNLFDIATEDLAAWMPANTFTAPTVTASQSISMTRIQSRNDGVLRLKVLAS